MLTDKGHDFTAVHTGNVHPFCSPHRITAARADVLPAVGLSGRQNGDGSVAVSACAGDSDAVALVPVNEDIRQVVFKDKGQQIITGMGDCPSVLGMMLYDKAMGFGDLLETLVVVAVASGRILEALDASPVVASLM